MSATDEPLLKILAAPDREGVDDLYQIADRVRSAPELLRQALGAIVEDPHRLAEATAHASLHPNGFVKIAVPRPNAHARLHVWPHGAVGMPTGGSDAHGHRWNFASWVIAGTLRETVFDIDPGSAALAEYRYGRDGDGETYLKQHGAAGLITRSDRYREAGSVYTRVKGDLHSADPAGDGLVITFVVQGPRSDSSVPVFRRPEDPQVRARRLSQKDLTGILTSVVDVLDALR